VDAGKADSPSDGVPSKLCAALACRGDCARTDGLIQFHRNNSMSVLARPLRLFWWTCAGRTLLPMMID
jgi:hypothetical protein